MMIVHNHGSENRTGPTGSTGKTGNRNHQAPEITQAQFTTQSHTAISPLRSRIPTSPPPPIEQPQQRPPQPPPSLPSSPPPWSLPSSPTRWSSPTPRPRRYSPPPCHTLDWRTLNSEAKGTLALLRRRRSQVVNAAAVPRSSAPLLLPLPRVQNPVARHVLFIFTGFSAWNPDLSCTLEFAGC
ncbi:uncharacterized protein DS421_13g410700 [Arachis hypogaea]|nr:uncharacterized protein DS421_13g410700 [Arachis hypogaea]